MRTSPPSNFNTADFSAMVRDVLTRSRLTPSELAQYLGTSLVSVTRWERGDTQPGPRIQTKLLETLGWLDRGRRLDVSHAVRSHVFASRGARRRTVDLPLFGTARTIELERDPKAPILTRLRHGDIWGDAAAALSCVLSAHAEAAPRPGVPAASGARAPAGPPPFLE